MSLLRLLTAGKSLIGLKGSDSHYRPSQPGALPRFGGKKNPFRATTRPEAAHPAETEPAETACEHAERPVQDPASVPAATTEATAVFGAPVMTPGAEAAAVSAPPQAKSSVSGAIARCAGKLKHLMPFRGQKAPKTAVPRFSKPMVQTELSLESVRVVRNDLSDSDVEIVPAQPPVAPAAEQPAAGALEKVTGRLFGAGKG